MEFLSPTALIIILVVAILLFFALREVNCWYWKINRQIELQHEIIDLLKKLNDHKENKEINPSEPVGPVEQTSLNDPEVMEQLLNQLNKRK